MTGISTNDNLNFLRQGGRKSVCKEEKTPSRTNKSHVIPSRLRTKSEKQSDTKIKLGFSKRSNDVYIRTEEHPMIINRMQESSNLSRLSDIRTNTANVATPIHINKEVQKISFENSYNPSSLINSKCTSQGLRVDKNNEILKNKVADDLVFQEYYNLNNQNMSQKFGISKLISEDDNFVKVNLFSKNLNSEFGVLDKIQYSKDSKKPFAGSEKDKGIIISKDKCFSLQAHAVVSESKVFRLKNRDNKYNHSLLLDNSILECQVCLERVDIDNLMPLSCFHVFHPNCLK